MLRICESDFYPAHGRGSWAYEKICLLVLPRNPCHGQGRNFRYNQNAPLNFHSSPTFVNSSFRI